jgi:outer membrane protein assembly factor BamB
VASGARKRLATFWNVKDVQAGPAGIYGLSHRGLLRRFAGGKFRATPFRERFRDLVAVGRRTLWVHTEANRLAAVDLRTGKVRFTVAVEIDAADPRDVDAVTDDLAFVTGDRFHRVRVADGTLETREEPGE